MCQAVRNWIPTPRPLLDRWSERRGPHPAPLGLAGRDTPRSGFREPQQKTGNVSRRGQTKMNEGLLWRCLTSRLRWPNRGRLISWSWTRKSNTSHHPRLSACHNSSGGLQIATAARDTTNLYVSSCRWCRERDGVDNEMRIENA